MICAVLLALSLFSWLSQSAQADSPKSERPTGQEAPKPKVPRIRIGGNVAKSQLKHKVQPQYPQEARDNRIQGTVRLHVVLSTAGKVQQLEIVSGDPVLAKTALEAVRQWEYKPTLLNGEPVDVLAVEQEIARVRGEIEQMEAEQKTLEHRVDFATIELKLSEEYKAKLDSPAPAISTLVHNAAVSGYRNVADSLVSIVLFFAEYGPVLTFWLLLFFIPVWLVWRRWHHATAAI